MTAHDPWDWDAWLGETHQHVTTLQDRIRQDTIRAAGGLRAYNSPGLIDPQTGRTVGGELCWVCCSTLTHKGRHQPTFRCCYWCLHYDKTQARKLGLKMLLPLMGWHCQPGLPGHRYPTNPQVVQILKGVWNSTELLNDWRLSNVQREYALLQEPGHGIHLHDWIQRFGYGWHRSKHQWWHFVEVHALGLAELLNDRR